MKAIISLTLTFSIPITFGALCGTISERGGIIMLGVEGMMLLGAMAGVIGSYLTSNPWFGVLFALIIGAITGFVYCLFCLRFKAHQSVIGVGLNVLASGVTEVLLKAFWGQEGMSDFVKTVPRIKIKAFANIPILNQLFADQSVYFYFMIIAVVLTWIVFYKSKIGLRYRAIGDHPLAVKTAGIDVNKYRYIALTIAGALAALGGSFLSISYNNLFVDGMVAGRGFMALAASIFGGWTPFGCLLASLVFAGSQAISFNLTGSPVPIYFVQMLPYVTTLAVLMFTGKKVRGPEALGKLVD